MSQKKYEIAIFPEVGFMTSRFFGHIQLHDMVLFTKEIIHHPEYSPYFPLICDFRASKAVGYRIDVGEFVKQYQSMVSIPVRKKYGLIYSTFNQKFIFSILKLSGPRLNLDIDFFKSLDDCLLWMTSDDRAIQLLKRHFDNQ